MESAPTLSQVIQAFKRYTTIQYVKLVKEGRAPSFDQRVWQRSFYDHVLRSEADYQRVWRYIDENPAKWAEDEYYSEGAIP
jgi:REP element-mobilizing transposase RayT